MGVGLGVLAAATLFWLGCEETSTHTAIIVTPSEVEYTGSLAVAVFFTAEKAPLPGQTDLSTNRWDRLYLPLEWSVRDSSLGGFIAVSGYNAEYAGTGEPGLQIVSVRDQAGNEGMATIITR
jgi:hypothetical protein